MGTDVLAFAEWLLNPLGDRPGLAEIFVDKYLRETT